MFTCFCRRGIMSQCDPAGQDPKLCHFWERHSFGPDCSNLNPNLSDHCWSPQAQDNGYNPHVEEAKAEWNSEDFTTDELDYMLKDDDEDDPFVMPKVVVSAILVQDCQYCSNYICGDLNKHNTLAQSRGGLTAQDLINIGSACPNYSDNMSVIGGTTP